MLTCSVCSVDLENEDDIGLEGFIGIIPVALCVICWNGLREAAEMTTDCKHGLMCPVCEEEKA